jgi:hypothetical protein
LIAVLGERPDSQRDEEDRGREAMIRHITIGLALAVALASLAHAQTVLYVDAGSPDDGPGHDWEHAYHYLQDALTAAASPGYEILVAGGTYHPDKSTANPTGTGNREATFQLSSGVVIKGGYAGYGAIDPDERNIPLYETILSGGIGTPEDKTDNSRHVVTGSFTDATAVLDGFTITSGYADGEWPENCGGGVFIIEVGSPRFANCTFVGNEAEVLGGGMYNSQGSPTVDACTFTGNTAGSGGGGICNDNADSTVSDSTFSGNATSGTGGGMLSLVGTTTVVNCTFIGNEAGYGGGLDNDGATATIADCTFIGNTSYGDGGGMYNGGSSLTVLNCAFMNNVARGVWNVQGGAMRNYFCNLTVTNCTFSGNYVLAEELALGGGMFNACGDLTMTNCIFSGNHALVEAPEAGSAESYGGGLHSRATIGTVANSTFVGNRATAASDGVHTISSGGGIYTEEDDLSLTNCILWGNAADTGSEIYGGSSTPSVTYSCVQGGWSGEGNISVDPMLSAGDLHLMPGSPCIDAGDNTAVPADTGDLDGDGDTSEPIPVDLHELPRFLDDPATSDTGLGTAPVVDIGPYEYFPDCNYNGLPDDLEIMLGWSEDCNENSVPDECDVIGAGNFDGDEDVDLDDHYGLVSALAGPGQTPGYPTPECLAAYLDAFDFDTDSDVDLRDFAAFQKRFTGLQ